MRSRLRLPRSGASLARRSGNEEEAPTSQNAFADTPPRILVIEDDADTRRGVEEMLREEGFDVELASDGAEALALLEAGSRPVLILLDLQMPGMSGWEFRRTQLSEPEISRIPVVVMTGYPDYDEGLTTLRPAGFLYKPVRSGDLHGLLDRFR